MPFKTRTLIFNLSPMSIDRSSEWLVENMTDVGIDSKDRLRARLSFEEALINFAKRFGKEQEATVFLEKRRGSYRLRLLVRGERYNPLKEEEEGDEQGELYLSLFSNLEVHAQYSYAMGANVLRMPLAHHVMNPVLKIAIAIAVGLAMGLLGNAIIPNSVQEIVTDAVLVPISDMWVRLLQAVSGPIIFFTALTAALGTKRISDYGGSRFVTVARYFAIGAAAVLFSVVCTLLFFPREIVAVETNREVIRNLLTDILQIVPGNLLAPFFDANTPQLLIIAIATGYVLAPMGDRVEGLKSLINQVNAFGLTVAQKICSLVPYFVSVMLFLKIWTHDVELLGSIWIPLVASVLLTVVFALGYLFVAAVRLRTSPLLLARKLKDPFVTALVNGTLDYVSVDKLADSCKNQLGIDPVFAKAALPQGLVLFMPTSGIGIWAFVMFAAQTQQIAINQMWVLSAAALAVVLAVATPPVNGANLLAFTSAFAYLGISGDAILDAMVFDIVFSVLCIAVDQAVLQLETTLQAKQLGFLDETALRAPVA